MLRKFRVATFQFDINKYKFFVIEIAFFKLIISINNNKINFAKIKIIVK